MAAVAKISPRHRVLQLVFAIGFTVTLLADTSFAFQFSAPSGGNGFSNQPGPSVDAPQTNLTPIAPPPTAYQPPTGYGSFDPYATTTPGAAIAPIPGITQSLGPGVTTIGPPSVPTTSSASIAPPGSLLGRFFSRPASQPLPGYGPTSSPSIYGTPSYGTAGTNGIYGPAGYPTSAYPASTPNSLFPQGFGDFQYDALMQNPADGYSAYSLLQGPRFRYTFVGEGSKPYMLGINDFDTSIVFAFPNFLFLTQPLYVIPSFSLHLWNGPQSAGTGADLPSKAYSAFLDVGWESDPSQMFGTEFGLRFGGFSEFGVWNSRSFRVMGKALANFRLTPSTVMKGGVYYVNRVDIKLVPAFGFQCQPNPQTRLDLFFPQPRFSRFCRTVGTRDVWWYLSGDYGGGSWTVERTSGSAAGNVESIAIDDLRAVMGLEWGKAEALRLGRRAAFAEIGWVFNRKVKYRSSPNDNFDPKDSFMFRVGIGY